MSQKGDIFNNGFDSTYTFSASGATINWSGSSSGFPMVVSRLDLTYQRGMDVIYPINQTAGGYKKLNIVGAPSGTGRIDTILTPDGGDLKKFLEAIGSSCVEEGKGVSLTIRPFNACKDHKIVYTVYDVVLDGMGLSITPGANGLVTINQPLSIRFTTLTIS